MVDIVDRFEFRIDFLQQRITKRVKRAECDRFGALDCGFADFARRGNHSMFHLPGGLVGERQAKDFISRELRMGFEQEPDTFRDDARLPRARAGHHDERPFAMLYRRALLRVKLNSWNWSAGVFEQVGHKIKILFGTVTQASLRAPNTSPIRRVNFAQRCRSPRPTAKD